MTAATAKPVVVLDEEAIGKEENPLQVILRRFMRHRLAVVSLAIVVLLFGISIFAQQIAPFKRDDLMVGNYFLPLGAASADGRIHYLGTDHIGRDYFSRLVFAARISLSVAVLTVVISITIGAVFGALSGYYGGAVDTLMMRTVDFLLTLPEIPLLLILSSMLLRDETIIPIPDVVLNVAGQIMLLEPGDARKALLIVMVLSGLGWLGSARLMRGMVLSLREQTFVEAARSLGASDLHIIFRHMIPNAMAPMIVSASLALGGTIVGEAALSFLGFGIQDPIPTWGNMLSATQQFMYDRPYLPLIPGLPIFLAALAFNFVGDGLRDALDPRLKR